MKEYLKYIVFFLRQLFYILEKKPKAKGYVLMFHRIDDRDSKKFYGMRT